ncbi:uncharacterized protein LOC126314455 [Schistocerca gregaria]|uniref:uncharacterized protein LOC126314455 n=1 Tax=Schistocerca gregaria TaxID=7010 RepID=UPI00211F3BE6|nr:uncharacterized protein LOC126314455 [Schistocerca gregaria]
MAVAVAPPKKVMSMKRKFVQEGLFYAELNHFLSLELNDEGYAGVEVRSCHQRLQIIIHANQTREVLGEKGRRIRELTLAIKKRFKLPTTPELFANKITHRGLSALAQAESLRYKLLNGMTIRRACYSVLRYIMDNDAKGCELKVSGKLRGQRAKAMKFRDGYMLKSGQPAKDFVDRAVRHVLFRQGVLGIKVQIMLPYDPQGKKGPSKQLPDYFHVLDPKDDGNK